MACELQLTGQFKDISDNPLVGFFDGFSNGNAIFKYYDANTGLLYTGVVSICCGGSSGEDGLFPFEFIAVAGSTQTDPQLTGLVFLMGWNNGVATDGWNQTGTSIDFTDGTSFAGGERVKGLMTSASTATGIFLLDVTAVAGNTITDFRLNGSTVYMAVIDGVTVNTGITVVGTTASFSTVTFTGGEIVTLFYSNS